MLGYLHTLELLKVTCEYKPVLFADALHKSSITYREPTFPNHLRENDTI